MEISAPELYHLRLIIEASWTKNITITETIFKPILKLRTNYPLIEVNKVAKFTESLINVMDNHARMIRTAIVVAADISSLSL